LTIPLPAKKEIKGRVKSKLDKSRPEADAALRGTKTVYVPSPDTYSFQVKARN